MMSLETLKNNWESLAERDALYAILTDHRRAGGKWNVPEFMATGEAEIETVMHHLAAIGYIRNHAGQGVGLWLRRWPGNAGPGAALYVLCRRGYFAPDDRQGQVSNRYAHCRYLANSGEQLPFADHSFSFIYSNIVLQHVPRRFSTAYLQEFVRVLAPGGISLWRARFLCRPGCLFPAGSRPSHSSHPVQNQSRRRSGDMQMHCLPEHVVRKALGPARIVDIQYTNTAAKDFNGELVYLRQGPASGYVGKQYCVRL